MRGETAVGMMDRFDRFQYSWRKSQNGSPAGEEQYTYINGLGFLPQTPQQMERKKLAVSYNVLIFSILMLYLLRVSAFVPVTRMLSVLGLEISVNPMTGLVTMTELTYQVVALVCYAVYMLLPALFVMAVLRRSVSAKELFALPYYGTTRYGMAMLIGTAFLAKLVASACSWLLKTGGLVQSDPAFQIPSGGLPATIVYLLSVTLLAAFCEEFLFRGVILQALTPFGDFVALSVSTLLFVLVQTNLENAVYALIMGLVFGYFTLKTGSIVVPMAANFCVKALSVFLWMMRQNLEDSLGTLVVLGAVFVLVALSIFAFCRFVHAERDAFQLDNRDTHLTNRTKIKCLLTNACFWLLVILAFLENITKTELIN